MFATRSGRKFGREDVINTPNPSFSFLEGIQLALEREGSFDDEDLGPVDSLDPDQLKSEMDHFFGGLDSPLTTPPSSPRSTRSASPPHAATSGDVALATQEQPTSHLNSKQRRDKRKWRERRRVQRQEPERDRKIVAAGATNSDGYSIPRPSTLKKHVLPAHPFKTEYKPESITAASDFSGYGARREQNADSVYSLQELLEVYKFEYVPWDGRTAKPILDGEQRIIAVCAGQPDDLSWPDLASKAFASVERARDKCSFPKKAQDHRRGTFSALSCGISHGGGQTEPGNLKNTQKNERQLESLLSNNAFRRIAGFANGAFSTWCPGLYEHYKQYLEALVAENSNLKPNFPNTVWAAATFNFGPHTEAKKHQDSSNFPPDGLIIEFPAGSTIIIPSAVLAHSNTPIQRGERRASFTQYTAGGLFRWVDHSFMSKKDFYSTWDGAEAMLEEKAKAKENHKQALSFFSTMDSIPEDQRKRREKAGL
ncbi:hypothetical protein D9613_012692 [Agrocybe pediades]|uniref:Uncharacterized protein n=1 Tax=Agrocybe pediades TaxID=84607 RepID=A0A8H4QKU1_9AGAR|nr:hypothetical protein D9613_012692 [Agrocybe pediades]